MLDQNHQAMLDIGTSTNVNSPETFYKRCHPVYLTNAPYDYAKPLHSFTILYFLSTFDESFSFSQTNKKTKQSEQSMEMFKSKKNFLTVHAIVHIKYIIRIYFLHRFHVSIRF